MSSAFTPLPLPPDAEVEVSVRIHTPLNVTRHVARQKVNVQLACTREHPRRQVDTQDGTVAARTRGGAARFAVAATDVEHLLAWRDGRGFEQAEVVAAYGAVVVLPIAGPAGAFVSIPCRRHLRVGNFGHAGNLLWA